MRAGELGRFFGEVAGEIGAGADAAGRGGGEREGGVVEVRVDLLADADLAGCECCGGCVCHAC